MPYKDFLRTQSLNLELGEALRATPDVLLGVGPGAVSALADVGIRSVFDLAASATFASAARIVRAATDPTVPEAKAGQLPEDLFAALPRGPLADASALDVAALRGLDGDAGSRLKESLQVWTVRDLAMWPPYLAAKAVLDEATQTVAAGPEETPNDLLPATGRYPTERAYYRTYVLADIDDLASANSTAVEDAGALDVSALNGAGFSRPTRGARLTLAQSWYSEGVALGQLLHSLALAPGESTRVAMIDWSRQQLGMQKEQEGQTEQLVGDMTRKRALTEVQQAVASEAQNGYTNTSTDAQQMQGGVSVGLGLGAFTGGGTFSAGSSQSTGSTYTGSSGVRNLAATMNQKVTDATHQAASAARNRFASVVRELSQAEHENLSTRVVANYNHMHALTVQYYEVVQIYRTVTSLHRFEPCLFVPMKPLDFVSPDPSTNAAAERVVRRYRAQLAAAALDADTSSLLSPQSFGLVRMSGATGVGDPANPQRNVPPDVESRFEDETAALRRRLGYDAVRLDGATVEVPEEALLRGVSADFLSIGVNLVSTGTSGTRHLPGNTDPGADLADTVQPPVRLGDLASIEIGTEGKPATGILTLLLEYEGGPLHVPFPVAIPAFDPRQSPYAPAVRLERHDVARALLRKLQDDQLYYSQVIWRALDAASVAQLLASYTYHGRPLGKTVDPAPLDTTGNYLIFRMPWEAGDLEAAVVGTNPALSDVTADVAWTEWVQRHADFDGAVTDIVPLPSGGVFAESVLGRSNGAEKLDITRFWNWQDSPIPLQAPDIAALQAGSRARDDMTTPSGLAAPVVAFNNPPALPDPAGVSAALTALSNGNMFRDASGSAVAQALALAGLQQAGQGATDAGTQAGAALKAAADKEVELAKVAASVLAPGAGGGKADSVSAEGAKINAAKSLDDRAGGADSKTDVTRESQAVDGPVGRVISLIGTALGMTGAKGAAASGGTAKAPAADGKEPAGDGKGDGMKQDREVADAAPAGSASASAPKPKTSKSG